VRALPASLAGIGGAVLLTATLLVAPASAQPTTVAGLLAYYYDLSAEAELVNEELLTVQEKLTTQQEASGQRREGESRHASEQGGHRAGPRPGG
jgi:hypothetical protein